MSFATAIGDLIGSWSKRRMNRKRGQPIWILDQLDFAVFVILFSLPFVPLNFDFLLLTIFTMISTPSVTLIANWFSYTFGMKDVPW
ncbi:MAG: CDP-archaeol synthase [archaeon]|nr:CDP-archaeol synthase [archaeon]